MCEETREKHGIYVCFCKRTETFMNQRLSVTEKGLVEIGLKLGRGRESQDRARVTRSKKETNPFQFARERE